MSSSAMQRGMIGGVSLPCNPHAYPPGAYHPGPYPCVPHHLGSYQPETTALGPNTRPNHIFQEPILVADPSITTESAILHYA